jgi:NTE family protein
MALATTARQLGAVLGVALLVAVVGTPAPDDAVAAYHAGFALCAGVLGVAAACAWLLTPAPVAKLAGRGAAIEPLAG